MLSVNSGNAGKCCVFLVILMFGASGGFMVLSFSHILTTGLCSSGLFGLHDISKQQGM